MVEKQKIKVGISVGDLNGIGIEVILKTFKDIGENGIERIVEFDMNEEEKSQLNQTLSAVKTTVSETGL